MIIRFENERRFPRSALLWVWLCLFLCAGCGVQPRQQPFSKASPLKVVQVSGDPIQDKLGALSKENREFLTWFSATIPDPLPPMAYASAIIFDPTNEPTTLALAKRVDGEVDLAVALANPGTLTDQPNILCLRNQRQVSCSDQADVWQALLPPKTLVIVPTHFQAEIGDRLTFLFLADNDYKRVDRGSTLKWAFVEKRADVPNEAIEAPAHEKVNSKLRSFRSATRPQRPYIIVILRKPSPLNPTDG